MSQKQNHIIATFFEIHDLQLKGKKQEAFSLLNSAIEEYSSTTMEHSLWTWLLTEQVLRFSDKEILSKFDSFITRSVDMIEANWNEQQSHLYLKLEEDIFTVHLAIYYSTLVNLRNIGYRQEIQRTATAIRDRVFDLHLKGGMVICSPKYPFASTDLLLSVLPFGLFSPEDLVMVEAVKEIEKNLVQPEKVKASPQSSEHSNMGSALLSWYFLEKGDQSKSKHYQRLNNGSMHSASSYLEKIIVHYVSLENTGFMITHEPYGNGNKYEPQVYERFPRRPVECEEVFIQFTAPVSKESSATVHVKAGTKNREFEAVYVSEETPYWKANIGGFPAHEEVSYYIEWKDDNQNITSERHSFYPLEKVDIWNLVGGRTHEHFYEFKAEDENIPFVLKVDEQSQKIQFKKESKQNQIGSPIRINTVLSNMNLPQLYEDTYIAPIRVLVDRFGEWADLSIRLYSPLQERFFGMGERYHRLEYRGEVLDCYVYNQYRDQGARTYMPIQFFFSNLNYGMFIDTREYTRFDFAKSFEDVLCISITQNDEAKSSIQFFNGSPDQIVRAFTNTTGPAEMLPVWAFGPWMSSNNWDRDEIVRQQVQKTTELMIPATVLVLEQWSDETTFYIFNDAMYESTDGSKALAYEDYHFPEWGRWPNPKELVEYINQNGMELILWQIPVMKYLNRQHHQQKDHDEAYMIEKQYTIKDKKNEPYRIPEGWFKESLLMDFSNSEGAKWWFAKRQYLLDIGVAGFKTDGGEMVFGDEIQFADESLGSAMRNQYPNDYIKAYYDFAQAHRPNNAMTFSRAGYTGAQKIPAHWAGDERSTFDAFKRSLIAGLSAGLSGVIMWGWDLAGFNGDIPSAELFIRSAQMAAFCPIMQYHAESKAEFNQDRTPWNIAERTKDERAIIGYRFFANVRMNLLPYIVEQAKLSVTTGTPLMKAMVLDSPEDPKTYSMFDQYFFGNNLLAAPVIEEGSEKRTVYLPADKWVNLFNKQVYQGSQYIQVNAPLMEVPVFQRNNSCIITNVAKENKLLGSYVGNSVSSYNHPVLHIACSQSFSYIGQDHLNEQWNIDINHLDKNIVAVDIETINKEFSVIYTNTADVEITIRINGSESVKAVGQNETVVITH